ncbi:MAG: FAD-binding oxidoreductase, partial [Geminicoccaceae bacterium]|nr:FAD-binding oxidoreductase [Geminicoccaceae bacterium]
MRRAVVVGAGIVGTSAALFLQDDGWAVTLLDPLPPGQGTSFGNAGIVSLGSVLPVGEPRLWRRVPAMLRDPGGALRLRRRDLPRLAPWLWRFLRASRPDRVEASTTALAPLLAAADRAHDAVIQRAGLGDLVHRVGWLKVAMSEAAMLQATARERAAYARFGIPHETLDADGVRALEPALGEGVRAGLFLPQNRAVRNPAAYVAGIAEAFVRRGGRIVRGRAEAIETADGRATAVRRAGGDLPADLVVLAAGAFSAPLARPLGLRPPLRAERGYHAMLPHPPVTLTRPVQCLEHGFVLAPMQGGLRLTSGVELAGLD